MCLEKLKNISHRKSASKSSVMTPDLETDLQRILDFDSFREVFRTLRSIDADKAREIEVTLRKRTEETHKKIKESRDFGLLSYWLLQEYVELNDHASSYLHFAEKMAARESRLWQFAFLMTERFFEWVSNDLIDYFDTKLKIMHAALEEEHKWYTGLSDAGKKAASLVINIPNEALKEGLGRLGYDIIKKEKLMEDADLVERILDKHLHSERLSKDMGLILERALERYKKDWEGEIRSQFPQSGGLAWGRAFEAQKAGWKPDFEFGVPEQFFTAVFSSAVAGTLGMAAGWHTLSYALLNFFPPVAVFALLGSLAAAFLTKEKALAKRKKEIEESVKQYHKYFIVSFEAEKIEEIGGKTLREALNETSRRIVEETLLRWQKAISGELSVDHYQMLENAIQEHLCLIRSALNKMKQ